VFRDKLTVLWMEPRLPLRSPRQLGSLTGEFHVPGDFDDSLPEAILAAFEGRTTGDDAIEVSVKVHEIIRLIEREGWRQVAQRGGHRQFRHPGKPGRVTVAGNGSNDLAAGTLNSILKQAGLKGIR
jgi:predicted RNA binding protein YcfA (HicA-like mRNA interferase family)